MTGFGRGRACSGGFLVQCDLRSVNHRFLEVRVRGLSELPELAHRCEEKLREAFTRGALELTVRWELCGEVRPRRLNLEAARRLVADLSQVRKELAIKEEPGLSHLISLGAFQEILPEEEVLWPGLSEALEQAIAGVLAAREAEGERLAEALAREADVLEELLSQAREEAPAALEQVGGRLRARLRELEIEADPGRLEQELVLWAERADVTEELDRLASHTRRLRELLKERGPVGRELEFLAQELGREAGTLSAKARSTALGKTALAIRLAAERIREQARNVE
ncbi:MAG: YicC domain protein [Acetothermia bacterium 64_32]|nr:MAG: YicC domain protein [Acetothermia bacterium 64_32]